MSVRVVCGMPIAGAQSHTHGVFRHHPTLHTLFPKSIKRRRRYFWGNGGEAIFFAVSPGFYEEAKSAFFEVDFYFLEMSYLPGPMSPPVLEMSYLPSRTQFLLVLPHKPYTRYCNLYQI
jgi:hypothetical protein